MDGVFAARAQAGSQGAFRRAGRRPGNPPPRPAGTALRRRGAEGGTAPAGRGRPRPASSPLLGDGGRPCGGAGRPLQLRRPAAAGGGRPPRPSWAMEAGLLPSSPLCLLSPWGGGPFGRIGRRGPASRSRLGGRGRPLLPDWATGAGLFFPIRRRRPASIFGGGPWAPGGLPGSSPLRNRGLGPR